MSAIFVTGGAGYVGTRLVESLLKDGHNVVVYDTFYYGNFLPWNRENLKVVLGDIRNRELLQESIPENSIVLHLACISNDASFELRPELSKSINRDAFTNLIEAAIKKNVKRFVYASTSSVYGVSAQKDVREDHPKKPLTLYNEYKAFCEPILMQQSIGSFESVIFRPATVCGFSPRMRFDLSVNILTASALFNNVINVFGGSQLRPNLHILDYINVAKLLLRDDRCVGQIYNVGSQNLSIRQIAETVRDTLIQIDSKYESLELRFEESNDLRSYHINSDKIKNELDFVPSYTIQDAVKEIHAAFMEKRFPLGFDHYLYHNVKTLRNLGIK